MKLSHSIDLEVHKLAAKASVNRAFPVAAARALKYEIALGDDRRQLMFEAAALGISVEELAKRIIAKANEEKESILALEAQRQALHRKIEAATSQQEINA